MDNKYTLVNNFSGSTAPQGVDYFFYHGQSQAAVDVSLGAGRVVAPETVEYSGYLFWGETISLQFTLGALLIGLAGVLALRVRRRPEPGLVSDAAGP